MKTHSLRDFDPPVSRGPRHRILSLLALVFIAAAPAFAAQPLNAQDAGTYALLKRDGQPSTMQYRVSLAGGRWIAEGREGEGEWRDISCDRGCTYRDSTPEEAVQFLPARQREEFDIACIQNMAGAFCRYTTRADPAKGGYLMAALVTGQPIPVFLRRVSSLVSTSGYTEWMPSSALENVLRRMNENRMFPGTVEGRVNGSTIQYRAQFIPFLRRLEKFQSRWGMSEARYRGYGGEYASSGYTEHSHTTYTDLGGNVVHQATWVLIGSSD